MAEFARNSTQQLRAAAARYPDDPELAALIDHPVAGPVTVNSRSVS